MSVKSFTGAKMKKLFLILFVGIIAVSCGPSVNPTYQKMINDMQIKKGNKNVADAGKFVSVMPYQVGQWVLMANKSGDKKSISKTSIVGKEGNSWIIETYSLTETEEGIMQIRISGLDKMMKSGNLDDIELEWVKIKKDKEIQTIDGIALSFAKGFYKKSLANMAVKTEGMSSAGSVTVPAGTFGGVSKISTEVEIFGSTYKSTGYYHKDVPINGTVKCVADDNSYTTELLDFGLTGAKASF